MGDKFLYAWKLLILHILLHKNSINLNLKTLWQSQGAFEKFKRVAFFVLSTRDMNKSATPNLLLSIKKTSNIGWGKTFSSDLKRLLCNCVVSRKNISLWKANEPHRRGFSARGVVCQLNLFFCSILVVDIDSDCSCWRRVGNWKLKNCIATEIVNNTRNEINITDKIFVLLPFAPNNYFPSFFTTNITPWIAFYYCLEKWKILWMENSFAR